MFLNLSSGEPTMSTPDFSSSAPALTLPRPVIGFLYLIANLASFASLPMPPEGPTATHLGDVLRGNCFPNILLDLAVARGIRFRFFYFF